MTHIHAYHIALLTYAILVIALNLIKWDFVSAALSENNSPSSMRLSGYLFVHLIAFCELWHTVKTEKFDTTHLQYLLVAVGVLFGLIKATQILGDKSSKNGEVAPPEKTTE